MHHPHPRPYDDAISNVVRTSRLILNEIGREPTPEENLAK
jgi:hypothetical protein